MNVAIANLFESRIPLKKSPIRYVRGMETKDFWFISEIVGEVVPLAKSAEIGQILA